MHSPLDVGGFGRGGSRPTSVTRVTVEGGGAGGGAAKGGFGGSAHQIFPLGHPTHFELSQLPCHIHMRVPVRQVTWRAMSNRPCSRGRSLGGSAPVPARRRRGLTLVHFSAQSKPCLTQAHTLHTPKHPLTSPEQPLNAPPMPQKALKLS